jgi:hypothetical protein
MGSREDSRTPRVRGRPFPKGNSGRPPGSKNKDSLLLAALMDGEQEELVRKGIELAKARDVSMLKFFLSRTLARERPIRIQLPKMEFADDAVEALGAIVRAVADGSITPSEGAALASLIESYRRAIDTADHEKQLDALEARINGSA